MNEYKESDDKCFTAMYFITKRINEKCHQCHTANDWSWFNRMALNIDPSKLSVERLVSLYSTTRWAKEDFIEWKTFVNKIYEDWVRRGADEDLIKWIEEDININ